MRQGLALLTRSFGQRAAKDVDTFTVPLKGASGRSYLPCENPRSAGRRCQSPRLIVRGNSVSRNEISLAAAGASGTLLQQEKAVAHMTKGRSRGETQVDGATAASATLLSVRGLGVRFKTSQGELQATRSIDFDVAPGERVGIVGESGCGKTITGLSILRLLPGNLARFDGSIVLSASRRRAQKPSRCCAALASPRPSAVSMTIRINCPAACASAS
jgi:ABC-type transport system involved in cytochrome bd biosynthesis fused ATPase/permease subunit